MSSGNPKMVCSHVVEITSDYLEGALDVEECAQLEQHLLLCDPCVHYIEQTRVTVRALGQLSVEPPAETARAAALSLFRSLRKSEEP